MESLTTSQQRNLKHGLSKNGYARLHFGAPSKVLIYTCPKCNQDNLIVKNWHGPTPRGGFYCRCENVIAIGG